jgi:hypothetical protein
MANLFKDLDLSGYAFNVLLILNLLLFKNLYCNLFILFINRNYSYFLSGKDVSCLLDLTERALSEGLTYTHKQLYPI